MNIPASAIVSVTPSVVSAGGSALDIVGLMLTTNTAVSIGTVVSLASPSDVSAYFGPSSDEVAAARKYFAGFDNSNVKPGSLKFAQYNTSAVAAYLRGANNFLGGTPLELVQAIPAGAITITSNGTLFTSGSIDLSGVADLDAAATAIHAAFTTPSFTVAYDPITNAFIFTSTTSGAASTITYAADVASGTVASTLGLTAAHGATLSQGADLTSDPGALMDSIVAQDKDWVAFMTLFDPDETGNDNKVALATWTGLQNNRYAYIAWDTDDSPTTSADATTSLGNIIKVANTSGVAPFYAPDYNVAAMAMGAIASIDFTQHNGRSTLAFKSQSGMTATVTNETVANNLMANGYNFYGAYGTANDQFSFIYPGLISGDFKWVDSYIDQIWMNNALQLALLNLLTNVKSVPYNADGYALIRAACMDPINAAVNFGAIAVGVPLSAAQIAEVNGAAGLQIDKVLSAQGWYLQILPAQATARAARQSPPMTLWYMDGGSIQQISLASVEVQ